MKNDARLGFATALSAYIIWGFLPVYWKALHVVPPVELLAWRIAGCAMLTWGIIALRRRIDGGSVLNGRTALLLITAALLITANWGLYIWAVSTDRIVQASLGYYINPLINVTLGVLFFSEGLNRRKLIAILLALGGVIIMTLDAGAFPWISILLGLLFGFYGMILKRLPPHIDSIEVLAWETAFLFPFALIYLTSRGGESHITGHGGAVTALLLIAGAMTLLPLWLFGIGAKRVSMGNLGFLQFIAPTTMLLLGVLVYGEPFGLPRGLAFGLVLSGLVVYTVNPRRSDRSVDPHS